MNLNESKRKLLAYKTALRDQKLRRLTAKKQLEEIRDQFQIPELHYPFTDLDKPARYKVFYGGRGGSKSWSFVRKLIERAHKKRERILCTRMMQKSIKDSVHRLICDQIVEMGLSKFFTITEGSIKHILTGSEFLFKGLGTHVAEIKSTEGITICYVQEAQNITKDAWKVLTPTIRKRGSEIWVEFNTDLEEDETYQRFVVNTPPDCILHKVNYDSNPFFNPDPADPSPLEKERLYSYSLIASAKDEGEREQAQADYDNIWLGEPSKIKFSAIFRNRVVVEDFETPKGAVFYHGADWGFANDPTVLVRCWIKDAPNGKQELFIDQEAFGYGTELDDIPKLFDRIPTARRWKIFGDCSAPATISHVKRKGFDLEGAEKWPGSVEDGITILKGFAVIHVHTRCKNMQLEVKNYCYKVDKNTLQVLPDIVDAWNHGWDAIRYALSKFIKLKPKGFFD